MVDQGAALIPNDNGEVLLVGGDVVAFLGQSSNLSFIFDPATQTFAKTTGSLITPRELFPLVALDPAVVTGALSGPRGGVRRGRCEHLGLRLAQYRGDHAQLDGSVRPQLADLERGGQHHGVKRATVATLFEAGSLAGEVIVPGGVDVEAGTFPSTCVGVANLKQGATAETDLYDPATGVGGTFTATGSLNQAREGQGQGVIGAGTDVTDLLAIGGACTTPSPSLQSVTIGTAQAATTCGSPNAQNDYSELYSQGSKTWTVGPGPARGLHSHQRGSLGGAALAGLSTH